VSASLSRLGNPRGSSRRPPAGRFVLVMSPKLDSPTVAVSRDPKDDCLIALAQGSGAACLVSGSDAGRPCGEGARSRPWASASAAPRRRGSERWPQLYARMREYGAARGACWSLHRFDRRPALIVGIKNCQRGDAVRSGRADAPAGPSAGCLGGNSDGLQDHTRGPGRSAPVDPQLPPY
jgi:hypothetical protein